jgi:hypothetical protein
MARMRKTELKIVIFSDDEDIESPKQICDEGGLMTLLHEIQTNGAYAYQKENIESKSISEKETIEQCRKVKLVPDYFDFDCENPSEEVPETCENCGRTGITNSSVEVYARLIDFDGEGGPLTKEESYNQILCDSCEDMMIGST